MHPLIDIHTHKLKTESAIEILNVDIQNTNDTLKNISMGIHPWNATNEKLEISLQTIENKLINNKLKALGEVGLDRVIATPIEFQKKVFIEQVKLSEKYNIPVIIHCVRAWSDLLEIRNKIKAKQAWIFHGYNGNFQTAIQIIKQNCFLSFGEKLLSNTKIQKIFSDIPQTHIFLETDAADISIDIIYKKAAELKGIKLNFLIEILNKNYIYIFNEKQH